MGWTSLPSLECLILEHVPCQRPSAPARSGARSGRLPRPKDPGCYHRRHPGYPDMALLSVRDLSVAFETRDGVVRAVNDVTFSLDAGKVLALLGESGSGKSVTLRAILGLHPAGRTRVSGEVLVKGQDVNQLDERARERCAGRRRLAGVPGADDRARSRLHDRRADRRDARAAPRSRPARRRRRARELLDLVQVPSPERCLASYPHEISGGMRQRAMIAIALACEPELLLADEPTTALDVTVQAQILWLLRDLQQRLGLAVIFVTHDLGVAAEIADDAAVMYAGRIVEQAPIRELFRASRASLHRGADAGDGAPRPEGPPARPHRRRAAEPGRAAARLRVRAALPRRARRLPGDGARVPPRGRRPRRPLSPRRRRLGGRRGRSPRFRPTLSDSRPTQGGSS